MTTPSNIAKFQSKELANYGFARARDIAFDAVRALWIRRRNAGMKQSDIANAIGRDRAWVSRNLRGPGNWTLRTIGELVEALDGELEIKVHALEDPLPVKTNYHAYLGYGPLSEPPAPPAGANIFARPTTADSLDQKIFFDRAFPSDGSATMSTVPIGTP